MTETYLEEDIKAAEKEMFKDPTGLYDHLDNYDVYLLHRENRIEALRAASRIVAGQHVAGTVYMDNKTAVLSLAEDIARWLEAGER